MFGCVPPSEADPEAAVEAGFLFVPCGGDAAARGLRRTPDVVVSVVELVDGEALLSPAGELAVAGVIAPGVGLKR